MGPSKVEQTEPAATKAAEKEDDDASAGAATGENQDEAEGEAEGAEGHDAEERRAAPSVAGAVTELAKGAPAGMRAARDNPYGWLYGLAVVVGVIAVASFAFGADPIVSVAMLFGVLALASLGFLIQRTATPTDSSADSGDSTEARPEQQEKGARGETPARGAAPPSTGRDAPSEGKRNVSKGSEPHASTAPPAASSIFLSCPMASMSAEPERYHQAMKDALSIKRTLNDHRVDCFFGGANHAGGDIPDFEEPDAALQTAFAEITRARVFVLYVPGLIQRPSSAWMEVGMAMAMNRVIVIFTLDKAKHLPYFLQAADTSTRRVYQVNSAKEMVAKLGKPPLLDLMKGERQRFD